MRFGTHPREIVLVLVARQPGIVAVGANLNFFELVTPIVLQNFGRFSFLGTLWIAKR